VKIKFTHIDELGINRKIEYIDYLITPIHCDECGWVFLEDSSLPGIEFITIDSMRKAITGIYCSKECLTKALKKNKEKYNVYTREEFIKEFRDEGIRNP